MDNQNPVQAPSQPNVQPPPPPQSSAPNISSAPQQPSGENIPPTSQSQKSNTATIITALLLLFVYPIGLLVMWFGTKWPKWVKFVLTLPVFLAVIGMGLAFFIALNASKQARNLNSVQNISPTPAVAIQTQGDRIVNADGGYSFILPKPWKTKISSFSKTDTIFGKSFLNDLGIGDIKVTTSNKSLSDALSKQNPKYVSNTTQITIDSVPGIIEDYNATDGVLSIKGKVAVVYKDGKTFTIEVLSTDPGDIAKFQEIISSFKFTQ